MVHWTGRLEHQSKFTHKVTRMAGFYNCLIFWNGSMSQFKLVMPKTTAGFINCFPLIDVYLTKLHWNVYILSTMGVALVGRLVCSVNVLYMELHKLHWFIGQVH